MFESSNPVSMRYLSNLTPTQLSPFQSSPSSLSSAFISSQSSRPTTTSSGGSQYRFPIERHPARQISHSPYQLVMRQQPQAARICSFKDKIDRRPLDPPPIIEIIAPGHEAELHTDSNLCLVAQLVHQETQQELRSETGGSYTAGTVVQSPHRLRDLSGHFAVFFAFPDLSIRMEGTHRLEFRLYSISLGGQTSGPLAKVCSAPFQVMPPKLFPGMACSSALTRHLAEQGFKLRVRKKTRTFVNQQNSGLDLYPTASNSKSLVPFESESNRPPSKRTRTNLKSSSVPSTELPGWATRDRACSTNTPSPLQVRVLSPTELCPSSSSHRMGERDERSYPQLHTHSTDSSSSPSHHATYSSRVYRSPRAFLDQTRHTYSATSERSLHSPWSLIGPQPGPSTSPLSRARSRSSPYPHHLSRDLPHENLGRSAPHQRSSFDPSHASKTLLPALMTSASLQSAPLTKVEIVPHTSDYFYPNHSQARPRLPPSTELLALVPSPRVELNSSKGYLRFEPRYIPEVWDKMAF